MMLIKVKVGANSKKREIKKISEDTYEVKVKNPALNNLANQELVLILQNFFKKGVKIIKGKKSKNKLILIEDGD